MKRTLGPGTIKGSVFTFLTYTVGAGILTLPYAVNLSGMTVALLINLLGMCVSFHTSRLLVICAVKTGIYNYTYIGEELYGPRMRKLGEVSMMLTNFGITVAYLVLIKGLIPYSLSHLGVSDPVATSEIFWGVAITVVIVYPLALFKDIQALNYTSVIGFLACLYLTLVITIQFFVLRGGEIAERI